MERPIKEVIGNMDVCELDIRTDGMNNVVRIIVSYTNKHEIPIASPAEKPKDFDF